MSELPGSQGERGNTLTLRLVRCIFLAVCGQGSFGGSDRTASGSQAYAAVLRGAPGPGVAGMGQQQPVLCAVGAHKALDSQQVVPVGCQHRAGAVAWRPHVLAGPQWRAVLVDELYAYLVAGLLGLAVAAQHSGLEHKVTAAIVEQSVGAASGVRAGWAGVCGVGGAVRGRGLSPHSFPTLAVPTSPGARVGVRAGMTAGAAGG